MLAGNVAEFDGRSASSRSHLANERDRFHIIVRLVRNTTNEIIRRHRAPTKADIIRTDIWISKLIKNSDNVIIFWKFTNVKSITMNYQRVLWIIAVIIPIIHKLFNSINI